MPPLPAESSASKRRGKPQPDHYLVGGG